MSQAYADKLRDPRWQKRRLEIMERDDFECAECGDKTSTLHVHHRHYVYGKQPWDHDDDLLVTLCISCHQKKRDLPRLKSSFMAYLCANCVDVDDFEKACNAMASFNRDDFPEAVQYGLMVMTCMIDHQDLAEQIMKVCDKFFERAYQSDAA